MLTRLDHIVLICGDINKAIADYSLVFGRGPSWEAVDHESRIRTAIFTCENTALELVAPLQDSQAIGRITELLDGREGILTSLAFETVDINQAHHIFTRRGVKPSDITSGESIDSETKRQRTWKRIRCDDEVCAGIKTFVLENDQDLPSSNYNEKGSVRRLDHLVINTPNPDRAVAHYGTRLGLRFALDRTVEAFNTRFLFFRIGGLTLEVIHRLEQDNFLWDSDTLWGLTWAVEDLETEHIRLKTAGLEVSDIRTGRKPGSQVFTLKSGTLGVPTLFIAHENSN